MYDIPEIFPLCPLVGSMHSSKDSWKMLQVPFRPSHHLHRGSKYIQVQQWCEAQWGTASPEQEYWVWAREIDHEKVQGKQAQSSEMANDSAFGFTYSNPECYFWVFWSGSKWWPILCVYSQPEKQQKFIVSDIATTAFGRMGHVSVEHNTFLVLLYPVMLRKRIKKKKKE